ncbi:UDP-N-acetylmuramate dehydrogenase [Boudabousia liubingyangii]|uniref:UDP-N-acetylmuramate dehydrogenase n=1 Tax=Boudabousia liubingyangii TaxID=1921764 RepID=UPI0009FB03A4|nr:UDP-N-acetylmuramate dehydrogenase [Boudabousia liubingyangii]
MADFPIAPVANAGAACGPWEPDGELVNVTPVPSNRIKVNPEAPTFADLTTLGVGGTIEKYLEVSTEADFLQAIKEADESQQPLYVIGGGSNTVAPAQHFPGTVIRDLRQEMDVEHDSACGGVSVRVTAGLPWDDFVAHAISNGWMGVEALSGIPGTVGAAPVQNIGAYGQEVAETLASVRVYDRLEQRAHQLALSDLELEYRNSLLKRSLSDPKVGGGRVWGPTGRWIVLEVGFQMRHATLSAPIRYEQLAQAMDAKVGDRVPAHELRQAVLEIRRRKGMVLDDQDRDTWSAGSFFTNPVIPTEKLAELPDDLPHYDVYDRALATGIKGRAPKVKGVQKVSAAWLIQHAGFEPGFALEGSQAALNSRHTLAITNQGGANATQVWDLAEHVIAGVEDKFGIKLEPEPVCLNNFLGEQK